MGLLDLFKGKKKDTQKPAQEEPDPNKLSDPGKPTADTVDLVSVIAIDDPFLITKEGAFVLMFEIPEIDMDIYGQTEAELCERYQMTLGALPPGTKFQLTVFEESVDHPLPVFRLPLLLLVGLLGLRCRDVEQGGAQHVTV